MAGGASLADVDVGLHGVYDVGSYVTCTIGGSMLGDEHRGAIEDEAVRRYHARCAELERREDVLRARRRQVEETLEELCWHMGQNQALVDEMGMSMPCMGRQAVVALDGLLRARTEVVASCDEALGDVTSDLCELDHQRDLAEEGFRRDMRCLDP